MKPLPMLSTAMDNQPRKSQAGVSMFVTVIMVLLITIVALAAFQQSSFDERNARGQVDRQLATQAAELAMRDAEMDLDCRQYPAAKKDEVVGVVVPVACEQDKVQSKKLLRKPASPCRNRCLAGSTTKQRADQDFANPGNFGLWAQPASALSTSSAPSTFTAAPFATRSNWSDASTNTASVALGQFTGATAVPLVARQPRYIIESFKDSIDIDNDKVLFRITAKGWGRNANTEVTLQQTYKP
jgi:type IV pilus assembly protein PilX